MTQNMEPRALSALSGWRLAVDRAPQFLSLLLVFLVPFLFQLGSADPVFIKGVLVRILLPFILFFWLMKSVMEGKTSFVSHPAFVPGAALLLWCLAGAFLSTYPGAAWAAWRDGWWVPLWFLLLTQICHELWRAENLLMTWMAAALGSAIWGITQSLGWLQGDWLLLVNLRYDRRALAGFGDPDHLAGYLLLAWPMALALLLRARSGFARAYWGLTLGVVFAGLVMTRCIPAWMGSTIALAVFAVLLLTDRTYPRRKWAWMGLVLASLMALMLSGPWMREMGIGKGRPGPSTQHRRDVMDGTWGMIGDRPVLGSGFGTYRAAFPPYRPIPMLMRQTQRNLQVRHAQHFVLEWWAENGSVGLLLLAAFWAAVLWPWWKLFRGRAIPAPLGAGAFAAFAGCAVNNLFNMDSVLPTTLVPLLFLAALPVPLSQRFLSLPGYPIRRREASSGAVRMVLAAAAILVLVWGGWNVREGLRRQWATVELKKALADSVPEKWDQAVMFYDRALELDPERIETQYLLSSVLLERAKEGDFERSLSLSDRVTAVEPHYILVRLNRSRALRALGRSGEAETEFEKAVRLDPQIILQSEEFTRAQDLLSNGRWDEAQAIYTRMTGEFPRCPQVWMGLGSAEERRGRLPEALASYRRALDLFPGYVDALREMGKTAVKAGRRAEAEEVIAVLRRLFPDEPWVESYVQDLGGIGP